MNSLSAEICEILSSFKNEPEDIIALHEPEFNDNSWVYVKDCLDSGWVSSVGSYIDRFENEIKDYVGSSYAVACVNGTAALQVALRVSGVNSNDEVLLPSLTFIATANAIKHLGSMPHFVDVDPERLSVCPEKLLEYLKDTCEVKDSKCFNKKTGNRVGALVPVHIFGHPAHLDELSAIADEFCIPIVEDAAEGLGSFYKEQHVGTFGRAGIFSFNGNKIITTGGGGMIVTSDPIIAAHAKQLTTTSKEKHKWEYVHNEVGYNYRMPNINAALGCAQLERLNGYLEKKQAIYQWYVDTLSSVNGIKVIKTPKDCRSNYWLNGFILEEGQAHLRDEILEKCSMNNVVCRPIWRPLHMLRPYVDCPRTSMKVTESLYRRVINVPSSPHLVSRLEI